MCFTFQGGAEKSAEVTENNPVLSAQPFLPLLWHFPTSPNEDSCPNVLGRDGKVAGKESALSSSHKTSIGYFNL